MGCFTNNNNNEKVVKQHSGVVDRCFGDKIFCHWNAAAKSSNHPSKACNAAFEIINARHEEYINNATTPMPCHSLPHRCPPHSPSAALHRCCTSSTAARSASLRSMENFGVLNNPDAAAAAACLNVRVAIATGSVIAGNVGAENVRSFQVFGPLMNLLFFMAKHARALHLSVICDHATSVAVSHLAHARLIDLVPWTEIVGSDLRATHPLKTTSPNSDPGDPVPFTAPTLKVGKVNPEDRQIVSDGGNDVPSADAPATSSESLESSGGPSSPISATALLGMGVMMLGKSPGRSSAPPREPSHRISALSPIAGLGEIKSLPPDGDDLGVGLAAAAATNKGLPCCSSTSSHNTLSRVITVANVPTLVEVFGLLPRFVGGEGCHGSDTKATTAEISEDHKDVEHAVRLLEQGHIDQAITSLTYLCTRVPDDVSAHNLLALWKRRHQSSVYSRP